MGGVQRQMVPQVTVWLFYNAVVFISVVCSSHLFYLGFLQVSLNLTLSIICCIQLVFLPFPTGIRNSLESYVITKGK
jgi:hypothetical protein